MKGVFLRAIEAPVDEKPEVLRAAVQAGAPTSTRFEVRLELLRDVPRSPFAYWLSDSFRKAFTRFAAFESEERAARVGMGTLDDFRFLRLAWEHRAEDRSTTWFPYVGAGQFSSFYHSSPTVVHYQNDGLELKSFVEAKVGSASRKIQAQEFYFQPGLAWPLRGVRFSAKAIPAGFIFSVAGKMAFTPHNELMSALALFNSEPFDRLIGVFAGKVGGVQYESGLIARIPYPSAMAAASASIAPLAARAWSAKRSLDTRVETSHAFALPSLLQTDGATLQTRAQAWADLSATRLQEVAAIQAEIDDRCFTLYGIGPEDRRSIEAGFGSTEASDELDDEDVDDDDNSDNEVDAAPIVASLLSWAVGIAFGRLDIRLATGARSLPPEPDPFDPLPVCSPGMLTDDDGLPVAAPPPGYPLTFPTDGVLVDDPGHPRDLLKAVRAVFDAVFHDAHARWNEAAELVGARGGELREWFARIFFGEHIKRYSKSRRKAPIYWQLATSSGSYSVWVYVHRATPDTLFRVLNDLVGPKLDHERDKLDRLTRDAGPNPSPADRDALAAQEAFVDELQALRAEVARVAPLWKPNLDDGVILNYAPLWRLVPQERSWQTECRKAWDKLCAGEYDWAHLAMHLWPERVVPKCAEDRSLAIARGLEDVFWREDGSGNWHAVAVPEATLLQLVEERTSSSVKAALKDLLAAPAPTGKSGGRRAPNAPAGAPAPRRAAPVVSAPARTSTAEVDEANLTVVRAAITAVAEGASKADVQASTGLSDADWHRAIAVLLERGDVNRTGQKRGTRYQVIRRTDQ
jgi:hypothetical protein